MSYPRVVAAIDFGTHGSTFAWAVVNKINREMTQREIFYFDEWDQQPIAYAKNLSALLLHSSGRLLDWGYTAEERMYDEGLADGRTYWVNYKMSLQQNVGSAGTLATTKRGQAQSAQQVAELVTLCIKQVYEKAIEHITRSGVYTPDDIRWCVTVPAIWDAYTRDLMYKAAVQAGLPDDEERLWLSPEPEAAALHCVVKGEHRLIANGSRFMVIDAGGGTVDITSYEVRGQEKLAELGTPNGDKAGSNYLNQYFVDQVLCDRFGVGFVAWLRENHPRDLYELIGIWERAKRTVAAEVRPMKIRLTADVHRYLTEDGYALEQIRERQDGAETMIVMPAEEVRELFEKVVEIIIDRADEQLEKMRSASGESGDEMAILVGGFAESTYLQARLAEFLEPIGVRLHIPPLPSVAVVTGATHFAYDRTVVRARRSPLTYGARVLMPFRENVDPRGKRELDSDNEPWCNDRFDIFVRCDDAVETDSYRSSTLTPLRDEDRSADIEIFATRMPDPEYTTDPGSERLGAVSVSLLGSMHLPRKQRKVQLRMHFGDTRIRVVGRNMETGEEQPTEISWKPTW